MNDVIPGFDGGGVITVHQIRQKTLPRGWAMAAALVACVGGVVSAVVVVILIWSRG